MNLIAFVIWISERKIIGRIYRFFSTILKFALISCTEVLNFKLLFYFLYYLNHIPTTTSVNSQIVFYSVKNLNPLSALLIHKSNQIGLLFPKWALSKCSHGTKGIECRVNNCRLIKYLKINNSISCPFQDSLPVHPNVSFDKTKCRSVRNDYFPQLMLLRY